MSLFSKIFQTVIMGCLLMTHLFSYPCLYKAAQSNHKKPDAYERAHQEPGTPLSAADEARIRTLLTQAGVNDQVSRIAFFDNFSDIAVAINDPQNEWGNILIMLDTDFYKHVGEEELTFVIGHEAGHVALGHLRWLPSLMDLVVTTVAPVTARLKARVAEYEADCFAARHLKAARGGLQFCARINRTPLPHIHPHALFDNPQERTPLYTYTGQEIDDNDAHQGWPHPITRARYLTPLL